MPKVHFEASYGVQCVAFTNAPLANEAPLVQNTTFWHVSYTIRKTIFSSISENISKLQNSIGNKNWNRGFHFFCIVRALLHKTAILVTVITFSHFSYIIWKPFLSSLGKDWYGVPQLNRHYERQLSSQNPNLGFRWCAKRSCSFQTQLLGLRPIPFCS